MPEEATPEKGGIWEIRLGIYATEQQSVEIKESITRLLCPDPDHTPPCPIPWSVRLMSEDAETYPALAEQARIEGHDQG